jgi:hypothetical protein
MMTSLVFFTILMMIKMTHMAAKPYFDTTIMLQENIVSINELAELLGHSSPKVTLAYYASVIEAKKVNLGRDFDLFGCAGDHNTDTLKKSQSLKRPVKGT